VYLRRRLLAVVAVLVAGVAVIVAVAGGDDPPSVPEAGSQSSGERRTSFLARLIPPDADARERASGVQNVPRSVAELARRLPTERKVAQLFLLGFQGTDLTSPIFQQLRRLDTGGLVVGKANYTDPVQLAALAGEAGVIARDERHVPPWVMAAQDGGEFNALPGLPPESPAADLATAQAGGRQAGAAGRALRPLGVNGLLGPVVDVGLSDGPAVGARAFSDEPQPTADYADAVVRAYRRERVFTAVKHFPGLGSASQSTEQGLAQVGQTPEELERRDLVPFRAAIKAGAPAVLLSHALYAVDDFVVPGSLSRRIATDLLRDKLKFEGVAITDDLADPPITALGTVPDSAVQAIRAGADMLYLSGPAGDQQAAYVAVLRAVRRGDISRARLNQAVLRVLSAKQDYGLIR
jgi:beta-N-acetylhexosaminidase